MKIDNFIESSLREEQKSMNLTDKEYDRIFSSIEKEITVLEKRVTRNIFKLPRALSDFVQVAAVIAILVSVPVFSLNYSKSVHKASLNPPTSIKVPIDTKIDNLNYIGKRIVISETPFYSSADKTKVTNKKLQVANIVDVEKTEKDSNGMMWYYVSNPIDSSNLGSGWLPEEGSVKMLSLTEIGTKGVKDSELKTLTEEYFKSLCDESLSKDIRIQDYKINNVELGSIGDMESIAYTIEYDIKPINPAKYVEEQGIETDKDGWLKGAYSIGSVRILHLKLDKGGTNTDKNLCILTDIYSESTTKNIVNDQAPEYKATRAMLSENGYAMQMNSGAGGNVTLPTKYSELAKYDKSLPLYIEYCLEISKAQGLDFSKYNEKALKLVGGAAVKKEDLSVYYNFVFLVYEGDVCGGWVEKLDYSNSTTVAIQTFDGRSFDNIVKDKKQWLENKGMEVPEDNIEKALETKSIDFRNPLIFKLMQ